MIVKLTTYVDHGKKDLYQYFPETGRWGRQLRRMFGEWYVLGDDGRWYYA